MKRVRASHVFRWDLDKTYLRTEFDSVRDLVKSALETAADKQAYPGAAALLRALKQGDGHRICIVSGSPTQMRTVLAAKLALDGIAFDEFVLKNNLKNLVRGRFRALRSQVPYKLPVMLESRLGLDNDPPETLFGDDAEADAIIYSLYADVVEGKVDADEVERIYRAARAYDDEIARGRHLVERLRAQRRGLGGSPIRRILIHLDRRSPTARFSVFGQRVVPIYNYFQAAIILYADGVLTARQVMFIAVDMLAAPEHNLSTLANSLQDLIWRGRTTREIAARLADEALEASSQGAVAGLAELPPFEAIAEAFRARIRQLGDAEPIEWPELDPQLDYLALVDDEHLRRRDRGKRLFGRK